MKKNLVMISMAFVAVGLMTTSCLSEEHNLEPSDVNAPQGTVTFNLDVNTDFTPNSRALSENSYKNTANYNVQVINATNQSVVFECKGSDLINSFPKTMNIGSYRVNAFYGTQADASRNDFRVEGTEVFQVKGDSKVSVNVNCAPTCGKLIVDFDADMAKYFEDYSVTYGGTKALGSKTVTWAKGDNEPWYVALEPNGETLNYTISLKTKEDYLHKQGDADPQPTGVVTGTVTLQRNKAHRLTVKPNYSPNTEGGVSLSITIDGSTNDKNITFEVPVTWI